MKVFVIGGIAESLTNFRGNLLRQILARGHCVFSAASETTDDIRTALASLGVVHQDIPLQRAGINPLLDTKTLYLLIKLLRSVRPHLLLTYTVKPVIYGSIAAMATEIDRVYSMITGLGYSFCDDNPRRRAVGLICRLLYQLCLRRNSAVFFQNPDDLLFFCERRLVPGTCKTVQINGSGVDLDHYSLSPLPTEPSFLLIGRLLTDKGIREYVSAARVIKQKYPHTIFRLVGGVDENPASISRRELQEWIDEHVVEYLGILRDVRPAIAASAVYVLPSYREGLPRSVLEAMAMGRPIITTNAPGCRETVRCDNGHELARTGQAMTQGGNGFLVPTRDANTLAHAMEQFIIRPDLIRTMGMVSREYAVEKFDVHKVNEVILRTMGL